MRQEDYCWRRGRWQLTRDERTLLRRDVELDRGQQIVDVANVFIPKLATIHQRDSGFWATGFVCRYPGVRGEFLTKRYARQPCTKKGQISQRGPRGERIPLQGPRLPVWPIYMLLPFSPSS